MGSRRLERERSRRIRPGPLHIACEPCLACGGLGFTRPSKIDDWPEFCHCGHERKHWTEYTLAPKLGVHYSTVRSVFDLRAKPKTCERVLEAIDLRFSRGLGLRSTSPQQSK